ncbi:MAG: glycosyltransferase family A protein [Bacteroidota bacterium]
MVSIIIPAYNYAGYIGECLDSVLSQSAKDWECIVVDNGSTDNTAEVVKKYAVKDDRIKYHYTDQKGVSFARNYAATISQGKYILPLDADDKIDSTFVDKAVRVLDNNPGISLVYCDAILFGAVNKKWILPDYNYRDLLIENSIFCSALFRKTEFETAGGYNVNMVEGFEDWDFWIKFLAHDKKVVKIQEPLFYYRIKENSRNSVLDQEKQLRLRMQIYNNHKELYHRFFSIPELLYNNYVLNQKYESIAHSLTYKIGKALASPVNLLKKMLHK